MSAEKEHLFQKRNGCWICEKLINNDEEIVRDHCHVTGKFKGAAHRNCNANLQLTKKVPVIFHKKPSTFISYLAMNNLYGWAMSEYLPCGRFKWLKILINLI